MRSLLSKFVRWICGWREGTFLLVVYLVALAPRLAFVLVAGHSPPGVDEVEYDIIAKSIIDGKGFSWYLGLPTSFRPPGYPWFLAGVYWLLGPNVFRARMVQAFLTAGHALLTYLVCKKAFNAKAARLSAIFVALYIPLILYTVGLMTENLFIPLILLAFYLLLKTRDNWPRLFSVLAGLALGASILVRPSVTFFVPLLFLWFYFPKRDWKKAVTNFGIIAVIIVVMVTPWSIRNYNVTGQFVYLDTRTGYNLYIGYHDEGDGSFSMDAAVTMANLLIASVQSGEEQSDVLMHNWGKDKALDFIKAHPWRAIGLVPFKFMHFWSLEQRLIIFAYSYNYIGNVPPVLLILILIALIAPFAFLVTFAVIGASFAGPRAKGLWLILLLIAYNTALHSVVFGEARLHFPLVPFIAMLAGYGLVSLGRIKAAWRSSDVGVRQAVHRRAVLAAGLMIVFVGCWAFSIHYCWPNLQVVLAPGGNVAQLAY